MKKIILFIVAFFPLFVFSQNEYLGQNYFDRGEFDKAILVYENLAKTAPNNIDFFKKQIICYQQLKQFDKAESLIITRLNKTNLPYLYVELGYNFQLQKKQEKADKNFALAIAKIAENPNNVYMVATAFEQKTLTKEAIQAYETGSKINPEFKFEYQIALLQGQLGHFDLMIEKLLDYSFDNALNVPLVQNQFLRFMNEDNQKIFVEQLRKALLLRTQKTQDLFWNQYMSWFFMQQKEYSKAFIQEKAIYKRNPDNFYSLLNLAKLAGEEKEKQVQRDVFEFILANTQSAEIVILVNASLIQMDIEKATSKDFPIVSQRIDQLLEKFGTATNTLQLQLLKANFEGFYLNHFENAKAILNHLLELPLNVYELAEVKLELGDLLLSNEKFNQAIIYYAQVQDDLPNDEVAHEAGLKMAKASYYSGDFDWAQKQFKVLKASTSQLIANDAMQMFLLISDNTVEDSTQVALKKFSKADFLEYQNKIPAALEAFKMILQQHKGQSIEDETLYKMAKLYEKQDDVTNALAYYKEIIDKHSEEIYIDEALFFSAEIYRKSLQDFVKAKEFYEKIIFNHQDSIYFVEAQSNYRKLRGDTNL
jgi:tetratricopeptide (TPR) repeat protein